MIDGNQVVQFQIDAMGQMYLLFEDGSMAIAEQQHILDDESGDIKVVIVKWFSLENKI